MKRKKISETLENISQKYIDEATFYSGKGKTASKSAWFQWVAAAACLALVVSIGIPAAGNLLKTQNDKSTIDSVLLIEYENAYFEIVENNPTALEKHGLEKEVSEEIIGNHIAYFQKKSPEDERSIYIVAQGETDIELLEYAPAPYKGVRIFRDGEKYYFALFCNYLVKSDECLPISDAFAVYGVDEASDIVSITPVKNDNSWEARGEAVTDSKLIFDFYNELTSLSVYSFDDYHNLVFADELAKFEEGGQDIGSEAYTRVEEDRKDLVIETKDGLRFAIYYYPSYGWINVSATMSYYKMTSGISEWFSSHGK